MLSKKTEISAKLFATAKEQFCKKIITNDQYIEILEMIYENLSIVEVEFGKKDFLKKNLSNPIAEINLKDTLTIAFAMN